MIHVWDVNWIIIIVTKIPMYKQQIRNSLSNYCKYRACLFQCFICKSICIFKGYAISHNRHDAGNNVLTHCGQVASKTSASSGSGIDSSSIKRQSVWPSSELFSTLGTNLSGISITINKFSFYKMHFGMSSAKGWTLYSGLQLLTVKVNARALAIRD